VKVRRIKDAFEKPFRNNSTTSLNVSATQQPLLHSSLRPRKEDLVAGPSSADKGKQKETEAPSRQARPPSPVWDIELDLNDENSSLATAESGPLPIELTGKTSKNRPQSPPWDIELDLNPSDEEEGKRDTNESQTFEPTSLL
jgi:DNA excision repair protein ERCC-1